LREADDPLPPRVEIGVRADEQGADSSFDQRGERGVELLIGSGLRDDDSLIDAPRRLLDVLQLPLSRRKARIDQNADKRDTRHQVAEQAEPFRLHQSCQKSDARGIAAGPVGGALSLPASRW
jgi:hypothetical protein